MASGQGQLPDADDGVSLAQRNQHLCRRRRQRHYALLGGGIGNGQRQHQRHGESTDHGRSTIPAAGPQHYAEGAVILRCSKQEK